MTSILIIQGKDFLVPSLGLRLHDEIKNSQPQIIDECDRFPHIEQPAALIRSIQSFLSCRGSPNSQEKLNVIKNRNYQKFLAISCNNIAIVPCNIFLDLEETFVLVPANRYIWKN